MSENQSTTYDSIFTLPVINYDRYVNTQDPKWLERDHVKKNIDYDKIWQIIEDEIIGELGLDVTASQEITLTNDLLIAELDYAITQDRKLKNKIRKISRQLKEIDEDKQKGSRSAIKSLIDISRVMGYRLDPGTTTVYEYIEAMKSAEQISKEQYKRQTK